MRPFATRMLGTTSNESTAAVGQRAVGGEGGVGVGVRSMCWKAFCIAFAILMILSAACPYLPLFV